MVAAVVAVETDISVSKEEESTRPRSFSHIRGTYPLPLAPYEFAK